MKKHITLIVFLITVFSSMAQVPEIKIFTIDGSSQSFKISEINNLKFIITKYNYNLQTYSKGSVTGSFETSAIDSINFESVSGIPVNLRLYYEKTSFKKITLTDIDSIVFTLVDKPIIDNIDPSSFQIGDLIDIYGIGFGATQGSSVVKFDNLAATTYQDWRKTRIQVTVPAGAKSGKLSVTVNGTKSNEVDYRIVSPPVITSIKPTGFAIGDKVTITGNYFGSKQDSSSVSFNYVDAVEFTSWSNIQIVCKVPPGTTSGRIAVRVNNLMSNEIAYIIKIPIDMVLIPAGKFQMGNTGLMPESMLAETPTHQVTISNSFYMSKFEVQQGLYQSVMGANPSNNKAGSNYPVERISWYMACEFCNKLSERDGYTKCYTINGTSVSCDWSANGYRLPTEAEWEYACKAGATTDFFFGSKESDYINYGWIDVNSDGKSHPVGEKLPNKWGLYDILGNLWEHVWDWHGNYTSDPQTDPKGPSSGTIKILRGGSWHNSAERGRCSMRGWEDKPSIQSSTDGIRVVRVEN